MNTASSRLSYMMSFLIVEDVDSVRMLKKSILKKIGFARPPFEAADAKKAREILLEQDQKNDPVEFVICDWEMPGESGIEFLKWIRSSENFSKLPFLMVTTVNQNDRVLDAIMAGASNYLLKPYSENDLKNKIVEVWDNFKKKT